MDTEQTQRIIKGSLVGGAGVGLLAALYDAVRSERRRVNAAEGKSNDPTLELYLPPVKQAAGVFSTALGGMVAAGGSYYLVQQAYKKWKQEQLKRETAEATSEYLDAVQKTARDKSANLLGEAIVGLPSDIMTLAPLAAAAGTYGLLEHSFPRVKEKRAPGTPRKIVIKGYGAVAADGPGDGPLAEYDKRHAPPVQFADGEEVEADLSKAATWAECGFGSADRRLAAESLCLMVTALPTIKDASSPLTELLGAFILDPAAVSEAVKSAGVLGAVSAAKGGTRTYYTASDIERRYAIHTAMKCAALAPSLALLAVAEFNECNPTHAKLAQEMATDSTNAILLTKFASAFHAIETRAALENDGNWKVASSAHQDWHKEMSTLDTSQSEDADGEVDTADAAYSGKKDPIDAFLAGKRVGKL